MSDTKKVKILQSVGDPTDAPKDGAQRAILKAGSTVSLPATWADRLIKAGQAEEVETKAKKEK